MKSISKFLLSTLAMLTIASNAYASGMNISVDDKRIITVAGETESEFVYIKVRNLSNQSDSRKGFRYIGKTETRDNGFIFSFYASDAGEYSIYVTDGDGSYKEQTTKTIERPAMTIDGGGIAGRKINIVAALPNAGLGADGTLRLRYRTDELSAAADCVTSDNAECKSIVAENGEIGLTYTITGENPKIYFAMNTVDGFSGDSVLTEIEEFTLKNRFNDSIECDYPTQKEIKLVTAEEFNSAVDSIVSAVNRLPETDKINAENYVSTVADVENCDKLIAAAVAIGADKQADIPADTALRLSEVKSRLEEIKPVAEALLELIAKENATDRYDYLKEKKDVFDINEKTFEIIDSSSVHERILNDMFKTDNYTVENVKKAVGSAAILNQLTVTGEAEVQGLLDDLEYLVGIDFPQMSSSVCRMIEKRQFETVEAVKAAIDAAIKSESNPGGNGGTGSGSSVSGQISGGGRKQSSASGSYSPTASTPDDNENKNVFSDMNEAAWAAEYVDKLYKKEIVRGDENGNFRPNDSLTRAEFVKMLVLAAKLNGNSAEMEFDDVKSEDWYYGFVSSAVANGIVTGKSDRLFGASDKLTRQDMVVLLYRTIKTDTTGSLDRFADADEIADYAKEAVGALTELNVVSGFEDRSFKPYGEATRAMAAKVICVLLEGGLI